MAPGGHTEQVPARSDALAVVREVTAAVASTHDVDEVLRRIARLSGQAVDVTECDIYEYDPRARRLVATATWGVDADPGVDQGWLGESLDVDAAIEFRRAFETETTVELHDDDAEVSATVRELMGTWAEKAWLIVPLVFGDLPIGCILLVEHRQARRFTSAERDLVSTLAVPAAIAIQNARLHRRMAEQNRFLGSLVDSSRAISSTVDLDDLLRRVAQEACEALGTSQATVYIHDPEQEGLVYRIVHERVPTHGDDDPLGMVYRLAEHPGQQAILYSDDIVIEHASDADLPADRRRNLERWDEKTVLSVPLRFQEERLGILRLYEFGYERTFSLLELQLARGLGELAGAAIHNAQSFRREQVRGLELETLLETSKAMASSMELEDVLNELAHRASVALGVPECLIYEYDEAQNVTVLRATFFSQGAGDDMADGFGATYDLDDYPMDRQILQGREIVEVHASDADLREDVKTSMQENGEKSCLSVPLVFRGRPLGLMELVETKAERHFTEGEVTLIRGLGELAGAAIHNAQSYREEQARGLELETLLEASKAMASSMELTGVLGELARRAAVAMGSPQCLIYEYDADRQVTILRSTFDANGPGEDEDNYIGAEYDMSDYPSDLETLERGEVVQEQLSDPTTGSDVRASMEMFGEKACLTVPLVFRGRSLGLMELVETERERTFTQREIGFARALADQAAMALNNARMYQRSKDYAARLESSYLETVTALAAAMEAKDHYTAEHADMLAMMAITVGRQLGLDETELRDLQYASVLHDIGKIGIPGAILNKPDKLTDEEFAVMAEHTIIGERIISAIDYLAPIGKAIRAAHERWDGRGYPDQLSAEEIPLASRILFVCDAFHAMTSDRPYRRAMRHEDALEELRRNAGAQFDPSVVDAFLEVWPHFREAAVEPRTPILN